MAGPNAKQCMMTLRVDLFEEFLKVFPETRSKVESKQNNLKKELTARLIGKGGQNVKEMERDTSTKIIYRGDHVNISGSKEGINKAAELIHEEIVSKADSIKNQDAHRQKAYNEEKEKVLIPDEFKGLVIGKKGSTLRRIHVDTGARVECKDGEIYVSGSKECRLKAIRKIKQIVTYSQRQKAYNEEQEKIFIPEEFMGLVIGKGRSTLRQIHVDTGARVESKDGEIYVSGSKECRLKAILKIKQIVTGGFYCTLAAKFATIDSSSVDKDTSFRFKNVQLPNPTWHGDFYELALADETVTQQMGKTDKRNSDLQEALLGTLQHLHEAPDSEVDMWCHFGHVYFKGVDEGCEDELFTASEITRKFKSRSVQENENSSTEQTLDTCFKEGITELEVQTLEDTLKADAVDNSKEDRWDFDFFTPSCQRIHAKVWLVSRNEDSNSGVGTEYNYVLRPPREVRNQLGRVMSKETGNTNSSKEPSFYLCATNRKELGADVILPGHRFDCRIIIRSCKDALNKATQHEVDQLADYLRGMRTDSGGRIVLDDDEIPEGYQLCYKRRSERQTYYYLSNGLPCRLTICKESSKEIVGESKEKPRSHVDIHLRCDEWDEKFAKGQWNPQQIVEQLPDFLEFVKIVQRNIQQLDKDAQKS